MIGKSKQTFDIEGSPLEKAVYKHQWEHQVFGGRPVPKHIRYNLLVLHYHSLLHCFVISMHDADHHKGFGHYCDTVSQCCCDSNAFGAGRVMCSSEASCGEMACLSTSPAWKVQLSCMLFALTQSVAHPLHKLYQGLHSACNVCLHRPAKVLSTHASHKRTISLHACTGCGKVGFTSALPVSPCKYLQHSLGILLLGTGVDENGAKFHWDHRHQRSSLPTALSLHIQPDY